MFQTLIIFSGRVLQVAAFGGMLRLVGGAGQAGRIFEARVSAGTCCACVQVLAQVIRIMGGRAIDRMAHGSVQTPITRVELHVHDLPTLELDIAHVPVAGGPHRC